jgi:hypothetical protein
MTTERGDLIGGASSLGASATHRFAQAMRREAERQASVPAQAAEPIGKQG